MSAQGNVSTHNRTRPQLVAAASLVVGLALLLAKIAVGFATGSLGILSEAAHSALDLALAGFALLAVRASQKPADREHPYGHGRAENLAAFAEGLLLLVAAAGIAYEAVRRLTAGSTPVQVTGVALGLMVLSLAVEGARAAVLSRVGRAHRSQALEAEGQNRVADVISSLGVLAGLIGVALGFRWADAAAALGVSAIIAFAAVRLGVRAGDILIDRAPAGAEEDLRHAIQGVPGVQGVRAVRVRRSGPHLLGEAVLSARRTLAVEAAAGLSAAVHAAVAEALPGIELTLVVEGEVRPENLVERVHAAAARQGGIRDLHNVTVEREDDGTLHLVMHAKLPGAMTLADATAASAELEGALRSELPEVSRIDVHLEPLEPDLVAGADVTAQHAAMAAHIRRLAEAHPEIASVRDVELSERGGRIHAHVVARMRSDTSLEHAHDVGSALEDRLRAALPELADVVARVTAA